MKLIKFLIFLVLLNNIIYALFPTEQYLYKNQIYTFPTEINIILKKKVDIPISLKKSTICQVPSQQLEQFNNDTNFKFSESTLVKSSLLHKNINNKNNFLMAEEIECDTVRYCDNSGMAGSYNACPGSKHLLVDNECMKKYLDEIAAMDKESKDAVLNGAKEYSEIAIKGIMSGLDISLQDIINSMSNTIGITFTQMETELMKAITDSASLVTSDMNSKINQMNEAASAQFVNMNAMINASTDYQIKTISSLTHKIEEISDYLDNLVSIINVNNFNNINNIKSTLNSIQQLATKMEENYRFKSQGVDISMLLASWEHIVDENTFQENTNNTYTYVSSGIVGIYSQKGLDIDYDIQEEISKYFVYKCYEMGNKPSYVKNKDYTNGESYLDTGRYITVLDKYGSILNNVTPRKVVYTNTSNDLFYDVIYGENNFVVQHPRLGIMKIHKCNIMGVKGLTQPIYDYPDISNPYATVNEIGTVNPGTFNQRNPGILTITVAGIKQGDSSNGKMNIIVPLLDTNGKSISKQEPNKYYYQSDIWCCDNQNNPVLTVSNKTECLLLSYNICTNTTFGLCKRNDGIQEYKKLISMSCGAGYNQVPISTLTKYKSPRIYYCSPSRKYSEPYGVELTACEMGIVKLPGRGVNIQTGVMSPSGLYPASCITWSSVYGSVPVYEINFIGKNISIPSKIYDLIGKKIAYKMDTYIIDEMDNLYGTGNSGYDCAFYGMDMMTYDPRNCNNFNIPQMDPIMYFSGKSRGSGSLSSDLYDIIPSSESVNNQLILTLKLKNMDYDAVFIDDINRCPKLTTKINNGKCEISGWLDIIDEGISLMVGDKVVVTSTTYIPSVVISDKSSVDIIIKTNIDKQVCNRIQCYASQGVTLSYPTDSFSINMTRPNEGLYIDSQKNSNFSSIIGNLINSMQNAFDEYAKQYANTSLGQDGKISINMTMPDFSLIEKTVREESNKMLKEIDEERKKLLYNVSSTIDKMQNDTLNALNIQHNKNVDELKNLYNNITLEDSEDSDSKPNNKLAIVSLVIACVMSVAFSVTLFILIKKNRLSLKKSKRVINSPECGTKMSSINNN